jgi:hypothetical protein
MQLLHLLHLHLLHADLQLLHLPKLLRLLLQLLLECKMRRRGLECKMRRRGHDNRVYGVLRLI